MLDRYKPFPHSAIDLFDPFIATSVLQKSLRRADRGFALGAAKALLNIDPSRLWRRLVIVAFEDFGLCDLTLTAQAVAAASDRAWRKRVGGDAHVMAYLVEQFVKCPRDRVVDTLYMLAVRHVRYPASRIEFFAQRPSGTVTDLVMRAEHIITECEREVPHRAFRSVLAGRCDQVLLSMTRARLMNDGLHDVCAQGRRTSMCLLPVLLPMVKHATEQIGGETSVVTRDAPQVRQIGDVPSYALDGFTRLGKEALAQLARSDRRISSVVGGLKGKARSDALTYLLFEAEGGICTQEVSDPLHDELKRLSLGCWTGLPMAAIPDAVEVMHAAVSALNEIRAHLAKR